MSRDALKITASWTEILALAPDRFKAYARKGDTDELDAIARYVWNIEVSKALHATLHVLEVTFRNQLHNALTFLHGQKWYESPSLLTNSEVKRVSDAKAELTRHKRPHDPGRIVAELNFGFWTQLYGKHHESDIVRPTLHLVLPHYTGIADLRRSVIASALRDARNVRNRISHFEPIAFQSDLPRIHRDVTALIGWMHPQMSNVAKTGDDFLSVYGKNWTTYLPALEDVFG